MKSDKISIKKLNKIGIALSKEKDINALLEMIVVGCKELTNADAGTLYLIIANSHLKFEIVHTDSLNYAMGGTTGVPINFPFIPLYKEDGEPNLRMVAAYAVLEDKAVNIADAYESTEFDFSGTKEFDAKTGYRSTSFLTIPMKDHNNEIIGALQLINAIDSTTNKVIPFSDADLNLAESLTSQAAVALSRKKLEDSLRQYVDLHKIINSILMVSWDSGSLQEQFAKVLDIILEIPAFSEINNGGVYILPQNGEAQGLFIEQNIASQTEDYYKEHFQPESHSGSEVSYLDTPIDPNHDHLVIPLLYSSQCVGVIFLEIAKDHRLSWEEELFLLSATEPVGTILERRHMEVYLNHSNQEKNQFINNIKFAINSPIQSIQENIQQIESHQDSAQLIVQIEQLQGAVKDLNNIIQNIETFTDKKNN